MKFVKKKRKVDIPWKEGAVLKLEIPFFQDIASQNPKLNPRQISTLIFEQSIVGWDGIVNENGKPFEFSEDNRREVAEMLLGEEDMRDKIQAAIEGPMGNSKSGVTQP